MFDELKEIKYFKEITDFSSHVMWIQLLKK